MEHPGGTQHTQDAADARPAPTQWSQTMRLLAAFAVGAVIGGMSVAQVLPNSSALTIADSPTGSGSGSLDGDIAPPDGEGGGSMGLGPGDSGPAGTGSESIDLGQSGGTGGTSSGSDGSGTTSGGSSGGTTGGGATSSGGGDTGGSGGSGDGSTDTGGGGDGFGGFGSGGGSDGGSGGGSTGGGSTGGDTTGGDRTDGGTTGGGDPACSREGNGGETDRGVSRDSVFLATTVVDSGIGKAFLGDVKYAMEAVRQKVNRERICGRTLDITYRDDGWEAERGKRFLQDFIDQGVFAIPVGPSSEGLNAMIRDGGFKSTKTPVVGTDGMVIRQYQVSEGDQTAQPWVWPVAVATVGNARIMAHHAYEAGARDFSIVFDRNYKFGQEAAYAFNAAVKRLTGSDIDGFNEGLTCDNAFCGIQAGQSSYASDVSEWEPNKGDFTALFLEPQTALTWMNDANAPAASEHTYGAAQTLFTRSFAENCKSQCDQMGIWTGFKPFEEQYRNDPAVQQYKSDVEAVNPNADIQNQFVEGAYVGMQLLVEAMQRVGPNLTRDRLKQALDTHRLTTGLTLKETLEFSPDNRYVATRMQRWDVQYKGTFGGWRAGPTFADPNPKAGVG